MSWLRIDDRFSRHPKVTQLNHKERWIWIDLLCYCASYQTGGYLPDNIGELVAGASTRFLSKCSSLELVDVVAGELRIHDWQNYAPKDPTGSERQAAWRRRNRNGGVTEGVTEEETEDETDESSTSRTRTGARSRPVLSSPTSPRAVPVARPPAREPSPAEQPGDLTSVKNLIDAALKEAS